MIPKQRLREIAAADPVAVNYDTVREIAAELLAARAELATVCAERDRYHDALVARHGGEPVALLSELDAARAENERLAKQLAELQPKAEDFPSWDELLRRPELDKGFGTRSRILNAADWERHESPGLTVGDFVGDAKRLVLRNLGVACAKLLTEAVDNWRAEQPKPAGGGA